MLELLSASAIVLLIFVLAGVAQAVSGFGSALVSVPLVSIVLDPATAVVVATVVATGLAGAAGVRERGSVDGRVALVLTLAGLVGLPVGILLLVTLDDLPLSLLMLGVLVTAVLLMALRVRLPAGAATVWLAGASSGVLLTSTGMNGPPLVIALNARRLAPQAFRATLQVVFCAQGAVAVVSFLAVGKVGWPVVALALFGFAGSLTGWRLGDRIFHRLSPEAFRVVVLVGLVCVALVTLTTVLVG